MTSDLTAFPRTPCRFLPFASWPGSWNMAVDEVLLEEAALRGTACWRFYGWSAPTLSLGYFQTYADRARHAASRACGAVRRLTGGGAILHDAELTYSIVLPDRHPLAVHRDVLYRAVHGCLIETLADWSIQAEICREGAEREGSQPFLCFERRSPGDVLLGPVKIAGSAQRRRSGAVLQHGSLLLRRSPSAPELPGLEDLSPHTIIRLNQVAEAWQSRLALRLGLEFAAEELSGPERQQAVQVEADRYAGSGWTENRGRRANGCQEIL